MPRQLFVLICVLLVGLASCGSSDDDTMSVVRPTPSEETSLDASPTTTIWERALDGEFRNAEVDLALRSSADRGLYVQSMNRLAEMTGIEVTVTEYDGEELLDVLYAGAGPSIASMGFVSAHALAARWPLPDLRESVGEDWLADRYEAGLLRAATLDGPSGTVMPGVWHTIELGGLVFYPIDDFNEAGYQVPATWSDLIALSDQMVSEGQSPWCIGIESGAATGWVVTDWLDELMARTVSEERYRDWALERVDFLSMEAGYALGLLSDIWFAEGYVNGGRASIASTHYAESAEPLFDEPPGCWLHLQRSFVAETFPNDARYGVDYSFFALPPVSEDDSPTVVFDGTFMVMLEDRPEVQAVMSYLASAESVEPWFEDGAGLSPHAGVDPEVYADALRQDLARMISLDTSFAPAATTANLFAGDDLEKWELVRAFTDGQLGPGEVLTYLDDPSAAPPPPTPLPPPTPIPIRRGSIADLAAAGMLAVSTQGSGIDRVEVDLENLLDELLDVEIPAGTYFVSASGSVQNMVVRHSEVIQLEPGGVGRAILDAVCGNLWRDIPGEGDGFSVQNERSAAMTRLMTTLDAAQPGYAVEQAATWIVSDDANFGDLGILVSSGSSRRLIDEADAAAAMQFVDESGTSITGRRIWWDRQTIAAGTDASFEAWLAEQ